MRRPAPSTIASVLRSRSGRSLAVLLILTLAACDGPGERAGRAADRTAAEARGETVRGEGPNELDGEARDRIERAEQKAQDARADAIEERADEIRRQAAVQAGKLDDQARDVRVAKP